MPNFFNRSDGKAINLDAIVSIFYDGMGARAEMCNGRIIGIEPEDIERFKEAIAPVKAETLTMTETIELTLDDPTQRLMEELGWIRSKHK